MKEKFLSSIQPRLNQNNQVVGKKLSLWFLPSPPSGDYQVTTDILPVITDSSSQHEKCQFNWDLYKRNLLTRTLGRTVIYSDIVTSTMDVLDGYVEPVLLMCHFVSVLKIINSNI